MSANADTASVAGHGLTTTTANVVAQGEGTGAISVNADALEQHEAEREARLDQADPHEGEWPYDQDLPCGCT